MLYLARPELSDKISFLDFVSDWEKNAEEITPYSARLLGRDYEQWLEDTFRTERHAPDGFVTAHTFFLKNEVGLVIGALNLRHTLNDYLLKYGGHIGYGIRPACRGNGYAKVMLALALPLAKERNISSVLITCNKSNIASAKTIMANGGMLENEVPDEAGDQIIQRYWIKLTF